MSAVLNLFIILLAIHEHEYNICLVNFILVCFVYGNTEKEKIIGQSKQNIIYQFVITNLMHICFIS
jgi:hypothetical protein